MVTAFVVVAPFLFLGNPSGHDFEFHLHSWMEVLSQWKQGIIYPRWAALSHYGFGEARFVFYPPASWLLGAALGALLPWKAVPGAYVWLALTLSGCSMFLLARRWLDRPNAIFAAVLYAANPYFIVIVYWRSAFAELLAGALLPLLLLYLLRAEESSVRMVLPLGLVVAAAWLTNAPAAVMVNYSLALLALVLACIRRSPRILFYGALAALLGAALAAFYVVPAAYEEKWVNISEVLFPGVRPQDNFLFTRLADADHNRFNLVVSLIAVAEIIVLGAAGFCSRSWKRLQPRAWWALIAWSSIAAMLMFSPTLWLWMHLPELRFLQLPWRWLMCLNVGFVLLSTMAWPRWLWRGLVGVIMLAMLIFVWHHVQPPWWDNAAEIAKMVNQHQSGAGYEGTDEYVPTGGDPYDIRRDAPLAVVENDTSARIKIYQWQPESKALNVDIRQPDRLVLRLFNYPAWQVEVNGQSVDAESQDDTGQMMIPVQAGANHARITFIRTSDRTVGEIISAIASILTLGLAVLIRKRRAHLI